MEKVAILLIRLMHYHIKL